MINVILFDDETREQLLPLTYTRPVCELRVGILSIREKWEHWLQTSVSFITQDYLADKYPLNIKDTNYVISGSVFPSAQLCRLVTQLEENEALLMGGDLIAAKLDAEQFDKMMNDEEIKELVGLDIEGTEYLQIRHLCDLYTINKTAIAEDFDLLTKGRQSMPISDTNNVIGAKNIFIEEGAKVEFATLNASTGPIYIGKNAEIMEGAIVRGPLALCEGSTVKMGAKLYGPNTIGPHSKVGGEMSSSVIIGYSNKGHEGYLGNSVIGEWCNIGADTNTSNLKNNYAEVKLWNYAAEKFLPTGQQFCGLILGDHSKCGINTLFNTGTVVGVFANIFGAGYPRNYIPSFAWGGAKGFKTYAPEKVAEVAEIVMKRRDKVFDEKEVAILNEVYKATAGYRNWEKSEVANNS